MKKTTMVLVLALAAVIMMGVQSSLADEERRDSREYGGPHGAGMGYGTGPMGGGMGAPMAELLAKLTPEKRDQVRKLHLDTRRRMIDQRAELEKLRVDLAEILSAFPLNQQAANAKFEQMAQARREMFAMRMAMMASLQQIAGKELWQETHLKLGMGPGHHMGPGDRGKGRRGGPPHR